jgi:hypothetical protein
VRRIQDVTPHRLLAVLDEVMHSGNIKISALMKCYLAYSGNFLPTFWDSLSVTSSRVKKSSTCVELLLDYIMDGPGIEF